MDFRSLAQAFDEISTKSSRTEITQLLAVLFEKASAREVQIITYLALGELRAPYEGTKFNMSDRSIKKMLPALLDRTEKDLEKDIKSMGDLGQVVAAGTWRIKNHLSIEQVYDFLCEIEHISGVGSQEERLSTVHALLKQLEPISAGLVVRMVLGKLRLGFSDMTIIDALSWMLAGDKSLHKKIENGYNLCADIGLIALTLKKHGIEGLEKIDVIVGIPIRPAAAERLPTAQAIIDKLGHCVAQPKLDGIRLQVHVDKRKKHPKMHFFSRNLQDMSNMFPDLVAALQDFPVDTCIMEGEAIVYDKKARKFLPFQETVKRKRKHDIEGAVQDLPLTLFIFDILYLDGHSLLSREHHTRRDITAKLFSNYSSEYVRIIDEWPITTAHQLERLFKKALQEGLEGLVLKRPDAHYQPGKRNFNWIKLKRQEGANVIDTLDVVVLGYYAGQGKRAGFGIGAFLVGVYNARKDCFETIAKIGTGLTDEQWAGIKKRCDKLHVKEQPANVVCAPSLAPDVWVVPEIVVVVRADEISQSPVHTAGKVGKETGFALRFPRMMDYCHDKSAEQATTVDEVKKLYAFQGRAVRADAEAID